MKRDIADYVARCLTCQRVRTEHQKLGGLLQPLPIPVWKWEDISMDFMIRMAKTIKQRDSVWVIVDKLTKATHFLAIKATFTFELLTNLYIKEIVRLHGVPLSIVSNRDTKCRISLLAWFSKSNGHRTTFKDNLPPSDGWTIRKNHSNFGGYVESLCTRLRWNLGS